MELWDLYDKERNKLNRTMVRGETIPQGTYHLVVHVWIRNSDGLYVISQRSASKKLYPLMYECVGGSVIKGETSIEGAIRETKEEVGIDLTSYKDKAKLLFTKVREDKHDILDVFLFPYDTIPYDTIPYDTNNHDTIPYDTNNHDTSIFVNNDEVIKSSFLSKDEIIKLYKENKLVSNLSYFLDYLD